ncbi:unnamed protein product [Adineta ricciae]|uniref:Uncharacterized protein n=1 Tax=Adineta ricciae TaxID=249248 RepID=A0A815WM18_ADIRI|nr:unnamed protein product [Adineta ricciae]CAF1547069.1 unnamed protein product [Adineta ricciae]
MFQPTPTSSDLPRNYLQFHENAFVSPLNLINVTHPAPFSFGRAPHLLQQTIPRNNYPSTTSPQLQSIDANKLHMYQFLAQRKLKEDRWKKELDEKNARKQTFQQRNVRSSQPPVQRTQKPAARSASAPKRSIPIKKSYTNESNRQQTTPTPIQFTRPEDSLRQNELNDVHDQLLLQLRILHNPPSRENIIDETEQEKQRRIRLKRERVKRDSRAIYNAHQELKQILHDIPQPDANLPRIHHRHLNAYKAILLAVETLANEAPLKQQDTPVQQLLTSILSVLETLSQTNYALGLSQLQIDSSYLRMPSSKTVRARPSAETRTGTPTNHLLPAIYTELVKKKQQQQQQRKPRVVPSVLRPRSAESVRLPRTDASSITRPTISMQHKTRARSHSPLPSIRSASSIETPFHSRFTVDHILVKLAPQLLANYDGAELSKQIERARTLVPMFLVDNRLTDDEITGRVLQMLMPRLGQQTQPLPSTANIEVFETPEEHARRVNMDVYQAQITTWEDEMSQIRQRLQNYRTNRLESDTNLRQTRTVKFHIDSPPPISSLLPENVHIHTPSYEQALEDFMTKSTEVKQAFEQTTVPQSSRGQIRLVGLDSGKIRQIERYRRDYQSYLQRTESAKNEDFDPCRVINRLSEFLLDEALLTVVQEVELLTVELSQKLVENELLGQEISLADVEKGVKTPSQSHHRPVQKPTRKQPSISPSPPPEQYNMSSFEEDLNTESKVSRSDNERNIPRRESPMGGTGRFTTAAFEQRRLPRDRSSSSSSARTHSPPGIILKPTVVIKKPSSIYDEVEQVSDHDVDSSTSSSMSKRHPQQQQQQHPRRQFNGNDDEEDEDLLLSTRTGEKIYSTDFDESKSKVRSAGNNYDEEDDDVADTIKSSARSFNAAQLNSSDTDDD